MIIKAILLLAAEDMGMATIRTYLIAEVNTDTSMLMGRIEREVEIPIDAELTGKTGQALKAVQNIGNIAPVEIDCWDWLDGMGSANKDGKLIEITLSQEAFNG
jgi:hypothetical protein